MSVKFAVNGLKETLDAFKEFQEQFGDKDAKSKVLIPAVREAMKPVLAMAKALSPISIHNNNFVKYLLI